MFPPWLSGRERSAGGPRLPIAGPRASPTSLARRGDASYGAAPMPPGPAGPSQSDVPRVSGELERWLAGGGPKTLGNLVALFGQKSFALVFVLLLGVPALPLPTGGVTHVFEIIAALLALQLIVGRKQIWLPQRWQALELAGPRQQRFLRSLINLIRRLERLSRPRLRFLFNHRLSNLVFGVLVLGGSTAAFLAPPFTGLDTLPALGTVLLSLGVLLEDVLIVLVALIVGGAGVGLEIFLGAALINAISNLV